jgi:PKD domain
MTFKQGSAHSAAIATALLAVALMAWSVLAPAPASADAFGQTGGWGEPGTGPAQLNHAEEFALDRTDGSSYATDLTAASDEFRLRKFSATGAVLGVVTLPVEEDENERKKMVGGVAVDHHADPGTVYVLRYRTEEGAEHALEIQKFSTTPNPSGQLVSAGPAIMLPTDASAIYNPSGIAFDPATGNLIVAGDNPEGKVIVQAIDPDGTFGTRWTDETGVLVSELSGRESQPVGLAVSDAGAVFFGAPEASTLRPRVWELAAGFSAASALTRIPVTTILGGQDAELPNAEKTQNGVSYGPQLAVSPDGKTLYYTEARQFETGGMPGNYLIHGISVPDGKSQFLYGGGEGATCKIQSAGPAIAAADDDGRILVLDHGRTEDPQTYGAKVLEFGPGGSGCPFPSTSVKVNGAAGSATANKGAAVSLEAASSELHGANPTELKWSVAGPESFEKTEAGTPAPLVLKHKFLKVGAYTIRLEMITDSPLGNPQPVTGTVQIKPVTPQALFLASTSTPAPGQAVTFDAGESVDPAGSPTGEPIFQLANYHWDFGDGSAPVDTTAPTITHAFANSGTTTLGRTVTLTVTDAEGLQGSVSQALSVQGTPVTGGGGGGGNNTTTPPPPSCATNASLCPKTGPKPKPKPKPLVCKKGFKKQKVKGKMKCVKVAKHKPHNKKAKHH